MFTLPRLTAEEIVIYLRKSRADDPLLSVGEVLAKHEQMLDEWMERNLPDAGRISEGNRYREVVSGESLDSRPEVLKVFGRAESPRVKALLIVEPQRLSRGDLEDIGRTVKLLRYSNTIVITLQYTYDLRDERDRDLFERELKRGNEFLEYTKRILLAGRLNSLKNGNYIGSHRIFGYNRVMYKDGKQKCYTLEPIPEEAAMVKMVFEMYRDGFGSVRIADKLDELGVKPPIGKRWSTSTLLKMRSNEHYIGKVVWNRYRDVKVVENGEIITRNLRQEDYLVFPGKHPAIIDQELWDAVQARKAAPPPVRRQTQLVNPFAGIAFCACGARLTHQSYYSKGVQICAPRLRCYDQKRCGNASCTVAEMEEAIISALKDAIADFDLEIKNDTAGEAERHQQLIATQEKRLQELERREISQWDKYTQEGMPKHIFDELNARVLVEKDEVQQVLCHLREAMPEPIDYSEKRALFSEALVAMQDPDAPAHEKNMLLKQCIDRIEYARKKKKGSQKTAPSEPMELDVHLRV